MKETFRVCPVCEKKFPRTKACARYCSTECRKVANRVLFATGSGFYAKLRREKYLALVRYTEQNNLKKILKKYKPQTNNND